MREFLEARLTRDYGVDAVKTLHRTVAVHAESFDWRVAAHHYWAAGDRDRALQIIDDAAQSIIGRGDYLVAAQFVDQAPEGELRASFHVVLSRRDFKLGDIRGALARANRAVETDPTSDIALANLASLSASAGDAVASQDAARRLVAENQDPGLRAIGEELINLIGASVDGDIGPSIPHLRRLALAQRDAGETHFEGITYLNLAEALRASGSIEQAGTAAATAIELLEISSGAAEIASARTLVASAQVHLGNQGAGWAELDRALDETNEAIRADVLVEAAELHAFYGSATKAADYVSEFRRATASAPEALGKIEPAEAYLGDSPRQLARSRASSGWSRPQPAHGANWAELPSPFGSSARQACGPAAGCATGH